MKRKWILRIIFALVLIFLIGIVAVAFSIDTIIKRGVETVGPKATQAKVTLKAAGAGIFSGRLELMGIFIGNPDGYTLPSAITVDDVSVGVQPRTIFAPKLVVDTIAIKDPIITLEGGLKDNNLTKLEKNLNDYIGSSSTAPDTKAPPASPAKPERKLQVNDLLLTGAKLEFNSKLSGGKTITLSIPDIHLTDLGTGPEGITGVEVSQRVLHAILDKASVELVKNAANLGLDQVGNVKGAARKAVDSVKNLFKH
ncbi:MAG TPA: hypothetical protein VGO67_24725 [Verrucomicrobiae bacterium]|jgi:uncharacterized protein involved in outer membrane biogenesis